MAFLAIDLYLMKKKLHKWGHKFTNKELKKEYKALKREKKQRKIAAIKSRQHAGMSHYSFLQTLTGNERRLYENEMRR